MWCIIRVNDVLYYNSQWCVVLKKTMMWYLITVNDVVYYKSQMVITTPKQLIILSEFNMLV